MSPDDLPPSPPANRNLEGTTFMNHTLPIGTMVGGLQITGLIGEGGFGVVYLAFDTTLQRQVALKEYMPSSLASRNPGSQDISVKSPRFLDTFNAGLRSFVNEARLLAHFDHPSLVKVHQFWQANKTAYMVMPYYQGPTLKAHVATLAAAGRRPDEGMLRQWLNPLMDALAVMHGENCFHRDIAPDNILLTSNGPLLLDFGAARKVISDMTQALTVILKPGYAPIEQYGDVATMTQGAWTDLYALASVVYYCVTGHSPITSVERVMGDPLPRLSRVAAGQYSSVFLAAIDAALAVKPSDRPQSVAEFRAMLDGHSQPRGPAGEAALTTGTPAHTAPPAVPAAFAIDQTLPRTSPTEGSYDPTMAVASPAAPRPLGHPQGYAPTTPTPPQGAAGPHVRTTPMTPAGPVPAPGPATAANAAPEPPRAPPPGAVPATGGNGAAASAPGTPASKRGPVLAAIAVAAGLAFGAGVFLRGGGSDGGAPSTAARPPAATSPVATNPTPATTPGTVTASPVVTATPTSTTGTMPPGGTPGTAGSQGAGTTQGPGGRAEAAPAAEPAANPGTAPATPPRDTSAAPPRTARAASAAAARNAAARPLARQADEPRPAAQQRAQRNTTANAPVAESPPPADRSGARAYPVPGGAPAPSTAPAASPAPPPTATAPAPARPATNAPAGKCAELLKKGSQGTLTIEEATFLRKECR